jgi:hypothetical protein
LVLAAAGFFFVSPPMLARSASMRLMTRRGAGSSFGASMDAASLLGPEQVDQCGLVRCFTVQCGDVARSLEN